MHVTILMAYYMPHRTAGVIKKKKKSRTQIVLPHRSSHSKEERKIQKNKYSNVADLEKFEAMNSLKC